MAPDLLAFNNSDNFKAFIKMTSSKSSLKMPDAEIPDIIFDPQRPHRKYERGKFLGKVSWLRLIPELHPV